MSKNELVTKRYDLERLYIYKIIARMSSELTVIYSPNKLKYLYKRKLTFIITFICDDERVCCISMKRKINECISCWALDMRFKTWNVHTIYNRHTKTSFYFSNEPHQKKHSNSTAACSCIKVLTAQRTTIASFHVRKWVCMIKMDRKLCSKNNST